MQYRSPSRGLGWTAGAVAGARLVSSLSHVCCAKRRRSAHTPFVCHDEPEGPACHRKPQRSEMALVGTNTNRAFGGEAGRRGVIVSTPCLNPLAAMEPRFPRRLLFAIKLPPSDVRLQLADCDVSTSQGRRPTGHPQLQYRNPRVRRAGGCADRSLCSSGDRTRLR